MSNPTDDQPLSLRLRLLQLDEAIGLKHSLDHRTGIKAESEALPTSQPTLENDLEPELAKFVRSLELLHQASQQDRQAKSGNVQGDTDSWDKFEIPRLRERFQFIEQLGQGGFGVVLLARDRHLDRLVALKLPRGNVVLSRSMVQRFLREAQHVAQLDHPNIVKVLGTDDASVLPVIIYAYCDGPTLAHWLANRQQPVSQKLATQIAIILGEAMQHAHRRGIIHRDLKPSNILLESTNTLTQHAFHDGDRIWIPRITDFGISKDATRDDAEQTTAGILMGTIQYMAPEQIQARSADIGWHSDVYSLGIILFELVTRSNPFSSIDTVERLQEMNLRLPLIRRARPDASRDLEAVVAKCLCPKIDDRYATAQALIDDLKNVVFGQPVSVRPVSVVSRLHRWACHQPVIAALAGVCLLLSLVALSLLLAYVLQTSHNMQTLTAINSRLSEANREAIVARQRETEASSKLADQLYSSDMQAAANSIRSKDMHGFVELMQRQARGQLVDSQRDLAYDFLNSRGQHNGELLGRLDSGITRMRFSHDWRYVLLATQNGSLHLMNAATGQPVRSFTSSKVAVTSCAFSPDDQLAAAASEDGYITVYELTTGQLVNRFSASNAATFQVEWVSDAELVVAGDEPMIRIWDWRKKVVTAELDGHTRSVRALAIDRDHSQIISGGDDHEIAVWNSCSYAKEYRPHETNARIRGLAIAPHHRWVMSCDVDGVVRKHCLYDADIPVSELARARQSVQCVAVGPDERRVAFGSREGIIQCVTLNEDGNYPLENLQRMGEAWLAHDGTVTDLAFSPSGDYLYSVSIDGTWYRWPARQHVTRRCYLVTRLTTEPAGDLAIAEYDDEQCLFASNGKLCLWNPTTNDLTQLRDLNRRAEQLMTSPALDTIVISYAHGLIEAVDKTSPYTKRWDFQLPGCDSFCAIDYCASRNWIAATISQPFNKVVILKPDNGQIVREIALPLVDRERSSQLKFSPDAMWLAVAVGNVTYCWNLETQELKKLSGHKSTVTALSFSNVSRQLVTGAEDRDLGLWDVATGNCTSKLRYHHDEICSVMFSPDDRSIVSTDQRGESVIWSARTRSLSMVLDKESGQVAMALTWKGPWLYRKVMPQTIIAERVK